MMRSSFALDLDQSLGFALGQGLRFALSSFAFGKSPDLASFCYSNLFNDCNHFTEKFVLKKEDGEECKGTENSCLLCLLDEKKRR